MTDAGGRLVTGLPGASTFDSTSGRRSPTDKWIAMIVEREA